MNEGEPKEKTLINALYPADYNAEAHTFTPLSESQAEQAARLIEEGADVNAKGPRNITPLGLAITYTRGEKGTNLIKLLIDKGASIDAAVAGLEEAAPFAPEYYYTLYELVTDYALYPYTSVPFKFEVPRSMKYSKRAYISASAKGGYKPAQRIVDQIEASDRSEYDHPACR
jgi:ankyrin repeat protein